MNVYGRILSLKYYYYYYIWEAEKPTTIMLNGNIIECSIIHSNETMYTRTYTPRSVWCVSENQKSLLAFAWRGHDNRDAVCTRVNDDIVAMSPSACVPPLANVRFGIKKKKICGGTLLSQSLYKNTRCCRPCRSNNNNTIK